MGIKGSAPDTHSVVKATAPFMGLVPAMPSWDDPLFNSTRAGTCWEVYNIKERGEFPPDGMNITVTVTDETEKDVGWFTKWDVGEKPDCPYSPSFTLDDQVTEDGAEQVVELDIFFQPDDAPVDDDHPEQLYCSACTTVVNAVLGQGCSLACSALGPPPISTICGWILDASGVCGAIKIAIAAGETPTQVCTDLGFCGSSCQCGVCTHEAADPSDGRCLGLPYDCGHPNPEPTFMRDRSLPPVQRVSGEVRGESEFCVGAKCDGSSANYGCCLTCM